MARALNPSDRRALWAALIVALLLNVSALIWVYSWLELPSLIKRLPPPFYTRVLHPQAEPQPVPAQPSRHAAARPKRRITRHIQTGPVAIESVAWSASAAPAAEPAASAPQPQASSVAQAASDAASEFVFPPVSTPPGFGASAAPLAAIAASETALAASKAAPAIDQAASVASAATPVISEVISVASDVAHAASKTVPAASDAAAAAVAAAPPAPRSRRH
ncbi:MAG: hypothetical protein LBH31_05630, partial [Burkholderiaceae bacterium]|nr:hypothetical protein [Burkholderiaceae bacterium]